MNVSKHVRFEEGEMRVGVKSAIAFCIALMSFGGGLVGIVRALDPAVTEMKFNAVVAEMRANDAVLAADIKRQKEATDAKFAENDKMRAFWVAHFQDKDEEQKQSNLRVMAAIERLDDKVDRLIDAGVLPRPR